MKQVLAIFDSTYQHLGLLFLRAGIGVMFIVVHGLPKMLGGPDRWESLGNGVGLDYFPQAWGFAAAFAETVGALFLILGLFSRYAAVLLLITMVMAATFHLGRGDGLSGASHAIELGIVFAGLSLIGPGKYSLDGRRKKA